MGKFGFSSIASESDASQMQEKSNGRNIHWNCITEVKSFRPKELEGAKFGAKFSQSKILVNTASPLHEQRTHAHCLSYSENAAPKIYSLLFPKTLAGKQRRQCRVLGKFSVRQRKINITAPRPIKPRVII
jgi:hypothetical protein